MNVEYEIQSSHLEWMNRQQMMSFVGVKLTNNRGVSQTIRRMFNGWK